MEVTDIVMPDLNGKSIAKTLTEGLPYLKCRFMSGYTGNVIADHNELKVVSSSQINLFQSKIR